MSDAPPPYDPSLLEPVARIFDKSVKVFGPGNKAVAWKTEEKQLRRFQIFSGLITASQEKNDYTINDLGCGYGAMFQAFMDLAAMKNGRYFGYDISAEMIRTARDLIKDPRATFLQSHFATEEADYSFVSGTYNMKMGQESHIWLDYVERNLIQLWSKSRIGLGFNMLSIHNPGRQKTLYYADPEYLYKFCHQHMSQQIRLINRLEPEEFVILVLR